MEILKCKKCQKYTMHVNCPICNQKTLQTKPPKFSPIDKYGKYRREAKKKELQEKGLA